MTEKFRPEARSANEVACSTPAGTAGSMTEQVRPTQEHSVIRVAQRCWTGVKSMTDESVGCAVLTDRTPRRRNSRNLINDGKIPSQVLHRLAVAWAVIQDLTTAKINDGEIPSRSVQRKWCNLLNSGRRHSAEKNQWRIKSVARGVALCNDSQQHARANWKLMTEKFRPKLSLNVMRSASLCRKKSMTE